MLEAGVQVGQVLVQVAGELVVGDRVELLGHRGQRGLQVVEAARRGGHRRRRGRPVDARGRRVLDEVERHVQLAREQAAALQLRAEAALDHRVDALALVVQRHVLGARLVDRGQAARIDAHVDRDLGLGVGLAGCAVDGDARDLADGQAAVFDRRAHRQAAHRAGEQQAVVEALRVGQLQRVGHLRVERELRALGGLGRRRRAAVVGIGQVLEGDAAGQHADHRLRLHVQALRAEVDVDPARVPEAAVRADEAVVGRGDEDGELDVAAVRLHRVGEHLAHRHAAQVDRRADVQRAEVVGDQRELAAWHVGGDRRLHVQALELALLGGVAAGVHADVGARQQRAQAADAGGADARAHDPEAGVGDQQGLDAGVAAHLRGDLHLAVVLGQLDAPHDADVDVLVLDVRLVGLDALGVVEVDRDRRAAVEDGARAQVHADDHRHQRHQPDQPQRVVRAARDRRARQLGRRRGGGGRGRGRRRRQRRRADRQGHSSRVSGRVGEGAAAGARPRPRACRTAGGDRSCGWRASSARRPRRRPSRPGRAAVRPGSRPAPARRGW